ncbi:MAG TPA: ribonuclease P protein component [Patescibacteria group bacterium]
MLKKRNRISKRKEIDEVKNKGRMFQSPLFGFVWLKKDDTEKKMTWIISKKISKKAVERNKIKRVLAELLRKNWEEVPEGTRGIYLVKRNLAGSTSEKIEEELQRGLKSINNEKNRA